MISASACARGVGLDRVLVAVDHEHRNRDPFADRPHRLALAGKRPSSMATNVDGSISRPQPTKSSICFVECGSVKN